MILIFGGTTEGRLAASVLDKAGATFCYSTRDGLQQLVLANGTAVSGGLDREGIVEFCRARGIRLIVDAAHPFAESLHANISEASRELGVPVLRYERRYPPRDPRCVWCARFGDAIGRMRRDGVSRLLALTGVQTIGKLSPFWRETPTWFRILDRRESRILAEEKGFPVSRLVYYKDDGDIRKCLEEIAPDAVLTKESGESGGFVRKVSEALEAGVKVYVVERPEMSEDFIKVEGPVGLRKAVERLVPGFYKLRSGFTTGSCATAAAKGALISLLDGEACEEAAISLPGGEVFRFRMEECEIGGATASATVVKDAGDDPDVTDGCRITATVRINGKGVIRFLRGEGVGVVTLPGLGLEVGEPAINPVPRRMMTAELMALCPEGVDVTISVADGTRIAEKTFNPRVGVVGGISIIGTSGVVMPFSHEAFMESIRREMEVAVATGCRMLVLNSGARSEKAVRKAFPALSDAAFIHYGNAVGDTVALASEFRLDRVAVGLMVGKAVKLAEGNLDTHSHKVTFNREFLCRVALEAGCSSAMIGIICRMALARELWDSDEADADRFFPALLRLCREHCRRLLSATPLILILIDDSLHLRYTLDS